MAVCSRGTETVVCDRLFFMDFVFVVKKEGYYRE